MLEARHLRLGGAHLLVRAQLVALLLLEVGAATEDGDVVHVPRAKRDRLEAHHRNGLVGGVRDTGASLSHHTPMSTQSAMYVNHHV